MQTQLQVLSEGERAKLHESTLEMLSTTGFRVLTAKGRRILAAAGAQVDEASQVVRFPTSLVETSLRPEEWTMCDLGTHCSLEEWQAAGRPTLLEEARAKVKQILETHRSMPLEEAARRELDRIIQSARAKS